MSMSMAIGPLDHRVMRRAAWIVEAVGDKSVTATGDIQ